MDIKQKAIAQNAEWPKNNHSPTPSKQQQEHHAQLFRAPVTPVDSSIRRVQMLHFVHTPDKFQPSSSGQLNMPLTQS